MAPFFGDGGVVPVGLGEEGMQRFATFLNLVGEAFVGEKLLEAGLSLIGAYLMQAGAFHNAAVALMSGKDAQAAAMGG